MRVLVRVQKMLEPMYSNDQNLIDHAKSSIVKSAFGKEAQH
jgi:hypothetical protein